MLTAEAKVESNQKHRGELVQTISQGLLSLSQGNFHEIGPKLSSASFTPLDILSFLAPPSLVTLLYENVPRHVLPE